MPALRHYVYKFTGQVS